MWSVQAYLRQDRDAEGELDLTVMQIGAAAPREPLIGCCQPASLGWAALWAAQCQSASQRSARSGLRPGCLVALLYHSPHNMIREQDIAVIMTNADLHPWMCKL